MTNTPTHIGSCHCGNIAYEVESDLSTVIECNCSNCYRKGLWLTFVAPGAFRLTAEPATPTEYRFNRHDIQHVICPICGTEPYGQGTAPDGKGMVAVNIRTLTDIDPFSVRPTMQYDGRSL